MNAPLQLYQFNEAVMPVIESVCAPLLKTFGITHFGHIRFNKDGLMLRLANCKHWSDVYYQNGFYNDNLMYNLSWVPLGERKKRLLIGEPLTPHQKILFDNNLWNFLLIYERTKNEGSFTFFGTEKNNTEVINHYLNNSGAFDHFLIYFRDKTFPFIEMKKDRCVQLNIKPLDEIKNDETAIKGFYGQTKINRFHLGEVFNNLILPKREAECLYYLIHGQSAKEIARSMSLSPRTVESYINNIKRKTGITNKTKLVDKFFNATTCLR